MHSKSFDTRTAASVALSQISSLVPLWQPSNEVKDDPSPDAPTSVVAIPEFPSFSVQELIQKGTLLLASSGKEFAKPTGILSSTSEVKKARKAAMGRLGLDFLDSFGGADEIDIEKELVEAEADVDMERDDSVAPKSPMDVDNTVKKEALPDRQTSSTPAQDPSPTGSTGPSAAANDLGGLSARERNRLKRKRKPGNSAFVAAPPPSSNGAKYNTAPAGPNKYVYNPFFILSPILMWNPELES